MDSDILSAESPEFTKILAEWLPVTGNWSVCWRVTRVGNKSEIFHKRCDSKVPTLTVVNVLKNNRSLIFGGFATVEWAIREKDFYGISAAPGSFLFSLRNNDDLPPFNLPLIDPVSLNAVFRHNNSGPRFGVGPDITIADGTLFVNTTSNVVNLGYSYQAPPGYTNGESNTQSLLAGSLFFTPVEVEMLLLKLNPFRFNFI